GPNVASPTGMPDSNAGPQAGTPEAKLSPRPETLAPDPRPQAEMPAPKSEPQAKLPEPAAPARGSPSPDTPAWLRLTLWGAVIFGTLVIVWSLRDSLPVIGR